MFLQTSKEVVVFVVQQLAPKKIYLARMARNKLGKDILNGFGGKVELNEGYRDACLREFAQENMQKAWLRFSDLRPRALVNFRKSDRAIKDPPNRSLAIYTVSTYCGTLTDSDEMVDGNWYANIPYERMLPTDGLILPKVFSNEPHRFSVNIFFDAEGRVEKSEFFDGDYACSGI